MHTTIRPGPCAALLLAALLAGCPGAPPEEGWQLVTSEQKEALLAVGGTSARDVWAVGADKGRGPLVLHFDGEGWQRHDTGLSGDVWWVHAFQDGPVFLAGARGTIARQEDGRFVRMKTPGLARHTVFGLWGRTPRDVYAVGGAGARAGFVWHFDGEAWRELPLPVQALPRTPDGDVPALFKVWGSEGEVWMVGAQGVVLRRVGSGPLEVVGSGTTSRLLTVHGAAGRVVVVGGEGGGTIRELGGDGSFAEVAPDACPLLQGVSLREDGTGWAVGISGEVLHREGHAWKQVAHGLTVPAESLHAVWTDSEGGVWAVGGNVLSTRLDGGVLLYRGPTALPAAPEPEPDPDVPAVCPDSQVDVAPGASMARRWNEQALAAIRRDLPRPGVHARNLYHLSAALWDAWAAYDATADGVFFQEKHTAQDVAAARQEAMAHAAYRVLTHRYAPAVGGKVSSACFRAFLTKLGHSPDDTSTEGDAPSAVGNRVAAALLTAAAEDGANEAADYADTTGFAFTNAPLVVEAAPVPLVDPSLWQPLTLAVAVTQNGIPTNAGVQGYIGAHWGLVTPFALVRPEGGGLYLEPGPAPRFDDTLRAHVVEVLQRSAELGDETLVDISPGAFGNNSLGANDGGGHPVNPSTGLPYSPQTVRRGDFGRVLAEFWADGPKSETPPGHWNVLANQVADSPGFQRRLGGSGPAVDALEWDVKVYLALNGALHDAAIAAWEVKRAFATARPISLVRYMGLLGQSSQEGGPSYHPDGLPLVPGLIEVVTEESSAPGGRHAHLAHAVGQVAVRAWRGEPGDRRGEVGGTGWIRAVEWMPYQLRTFVTPAFPGFVSGHSTFSRAGAEVLAHLTGSPYFPGGLGEFVARQDAYLTFEVGPASEVRLQWATYYDAADQAGQSRLWGGIHVQPDDFVGRRMGSQVGLTALSRAQAFYEGSAVP